MKPRFFGKFGGIKHSERPAIRPGFQRFDTTVRARNLRAIEYAKVLEVGMEKFFTAVLESNTADMLDPQFKHQMQAAVRSIYSKWADEPPLKLWHWLKNRSRFDYTLEFKPEENRAEFQLGVQARLFCTGEINDFGEIISRSDLDRWDVANKEKEDVPTPETPGG